MTAGHFGQKYHESGPGPGTAPAHPPAVISPALRGRRGCSVPLTQHPEPDSSRSQQRTQTTGPCKVQVHDANVTAWPGMAAPRWSDQAPSDRATPTTPHSPASFRQSAGPPHADQGCPTLVFTSLTKAASRSRRRRSRVRDSRRKPVAVPGHHHRPDPTGRPRRPGPGHRGVHPRTRRGPGHRQRDPRRQGGDPRDGLAGQAVVTGRPNCARTVPAQILKRLAGLPERSGTQPLKVNWVMCFGQAALLGVLRSVMAQSGPQGPLITNNKVAQFVARSDGRLRGAAGADLTRPVQAVDELRAAEFGGDRNIPFTPRKAAVQVVRYAQSKRTLPERDATRAGTPGPSAAAPCGGRSFRWRRSPESSRCSCPPANPSSTRSGHSRIHNSVSSKGSSSAADW